MTDLRLLPLCCASNDVGGIAVVLKLTASLVMVFSASLSLLAVTTQRYRHERGFVFTVGALYAAKLASVRENSSTSLHTSPVAFSCHRYDSVSSVSTPSKFVIAVYMMFPGVPATATP